MKIRKGIPLLVIFLFGYLYPSVNTVDIPNITKKVDRVFEKFNRFDSPGAAVLVQLHGRNIYKKCFGLANLEHHIPIGPECSFDLASVSKHLTSFAVLLLEKNGQLDLDDDIRRYLPELPDYNTKITIRHLLYQSSGLWEFWTILNKYSGFRDRDYFKMIDVLNLLRHQGELVFNPGTKYAYTNTNYSLLAEIIKRLMSRTGLTEIRDDLSGKRAALYFGHGMDGHSALALGRAFQWMGCDVEAINADSIKRDGLSRFDVLAIPGGESNPNPWQELGLDGKLKIQNFIRDGGGYIGICLGTLFASDNGYFWGNKWGIDELYLDIFPGVAYCGQEKIAPKGSWPLMTYLKICGHSHPITALLPDRIKLVCYPNGPYLQPYELKNATIIATFELTGNPAMVAFEYGKGRVFLSGPHPEIDVESDRDGSSKFSNLSDEESDWPLLLTAMKWITAH
jgi:glutamine amidotransferase-like uncharacterized protein